MTDTQHNSPSPSPTEPFTQLAASLMCSLVASERLEILEALVVPMVLGKLAQGVGRSAESLMLLAHADQERRTEFIGTVRECTQETSAQGVLLAEALSALLSKNQA